MPNDDTTEAKGDASKSLSSSESSSSTNTSTETAIPAHMSAEHRRHFLQQMVENLPASVKNRLTVLKNIQMEHLKLQAEFEREVLELEAKHSKKLQPFLAKRKEIVTGELDPPQELPMWKPQAMNDLFDSVDEEALESYQPIMEKLIDMPANSKGIPNFWLTVLLSTSLSDTITENDEPALKKLKDIRCVYGPQQEFTLEFHFEKNEYFSNHVLTKQYFRKCTVDNDSPFSFEGAQITHCKGCTIKWKPGKNLTAKTLPKGEVGGFPVKHIETESFFKFFTPAHATWDEIKGDGDAAMNLSMDFEMADFYRMEIIPKAVLYYSGEIVESDDEDDDDDEEEASDISDADIDNQSVSADKENGAAEGTGKGAST